MSTAAHTIVKVLSSRFSDIDFAAGPLMQRDRKEDEQVCVRVAADRLSEVMRFLYEDQRCRFEQLCDLTCVDYLDFSPARSPSRAEPDLRNFPGASDRYGVIYSLLSISLGHRLWVKCFVNDPEPEVPSVTEIWWGADWLEREVFDMFGVRFAGHPDLRRILTWDAFTAHPLRKDYPLRGKGERERYTVVPREGA